MTDDLYERYKEALRTGHVAVLRGQLEEAIDAYQEAASIAPARALPHTSLGGVYLRLNRVEEALAEYAAAVARAPQDEGALLGQAEALGAVGRFEDAAAALDRVAQIQETAGRLPEASDTLRRALELDEAPERMRRQRALQRQIRLSAGDQAAELALAKALRLREEPPRSVEQRPSEVPAPAQPAEAEPVGVAAQAIEFVPDTQPVVIEELEPLTAEAAAAVPAIELEAAVVAAEPDTTMTTGETLVQAEETAASADESAPVEAEAAILDTAEAGTAETTEGELEAEPEPVPVMAELAVEPSIVALPTPPRRNADELVAAASDAEHAGNDTEGRRLLVEAAREYAIEGRFDAGLDIAQQLIRDHPADVDAHLVLVELYISRNWESLAAEKLILLGRLAELDNDEETRLRLCAAASQAFPANGRLATLCA